MENLRRLQLSPMVGAESQKCAGKVQGSIDGSQRLCGKDKVSTNH